MTPPSAPPADAVEPRADRGVRAYVAVVAVLAVLALGVGWRHWGPPQQLTTLAVLVAAGVISWVLREPGLGGGINLSFTSIILVASAGLLMPMGAGIVGGLAALLNPGRVPRQVRLFNAAMISLLGSVGGMVYRIAGGATRPATLPHTLGWDVVTRLLLPLLVADVVICLLNAVLLTGVIRVSRGWRIAPQLAAMLSVTGPIYVAYGLIAFLWLLLWGPAHVGGASTVLICAPLAVAHWAIGQYGEEHRAQARTLELFTAALDARHHDARRHSLEVGRVAGQIAEAYGLGAEQSSQVARAGMLHDLGRLGEPADLLEHDHEISAEDLAALVEHPARGAELLEGIDFMTPSLDGIRHHHERWDGYGYPAGLAGSDIPLAARIVAAADLLDRLTAPSGPALTTEEAMVIVRERSGTHLDPGVVAALEDVLARHAWEPEAGTGTQAPYLRSHDDPDVGDAVAALLRSGHAPSPRSPRTVATAVSQEER